MKTFDCMYEERLMSLIKNCGASYVELISYFKLYGQQDLKCNPYVRKYNVTYAPRCGLLS